MNAYDHNMKVANALLSRDVDDMDSNGGLVMKDAGCHICR